MIYLTQSLGLDEKKTCLAEAIALLHDIGRFEQFKQYRTYHDPRSINHCQLGLEVLAEMKILDATDLAEKRIIEKAIEYHGMKQLPGDLNGDCLLMSKLVRDADKIDIYKVVIEGYRLYNDDPDNFKLEMELPDEPGYSAELVDAILAGEKIDYAKLKTWNDMKLLQLGWVYDINYKVTFKRIAEMGYLETIIGLLPQTEDVKRIRKTILEYVNSQLND